MKTSVWSIQSSDHIELFGQEWLPDGKMKGVIVLVHGLGEHSGRYEHMGKWLAGQGYGLIGFDLRGHGKSGGPRGHFPSYEAVRKDIELVIERVKKEFPDLKTFLYGHSLGGILVLDYSLIRKPSLDGVIATGPSLHTALREQKGKVLLANLLGTLVPGGLLASGLVADDISKDTEVVRRYKEDPLVHDRISFGLAKGSMTAIAEIFKTASSFPLPLLLMHGADDRVGYPSGSEEVARKVQGDCSLKIWDGLAHEIHNEPKKMEVFAYLLEWLEKH